MKIVSNRFAILCAAFGFASFFSFTAQAQITVDGTRDAAYGTTALSVQVNPSVWGGGNALANCYALQEGVSLNLFLGGSVSGNAMVIFIDSKAGGLNSISSTTLAPAVGGTSTEDNYQVNNLGGTNPFVFESGFNADYMIRVYGSGSNAWMTICDLQSASNVSYIGNAGEPGGAAGSFVTLAKASWNTVSEPFSDFATGLEIKLGLSALGISLTSDSTIKIFAMVINGDSNYAPNQTLGSLPTSAELQGAVKGLNLETLMGTQTISISTVANSDLDNDGILDSDDSDIDGDGLTNGVETNTGFFVSTSDAGTNPRNADTDGDGYSDGAEVNGTSALARVTSPLKVNYGTITVAGSFQSPQDFQAIPYPASAPVNVMTRVSGQDYDYNLKFNFRAVGNYEAKFAAGSWSKNWGASASAGTATSPGSNIPISVNATGFYTFAFNHDTLAYSFSRTVFADFAAYAAAYALVGDETADDDNDGLTNGAEFTANTDPTRANDALGPVITLNGNALVGVALNDTYTDAGATATDNVDPSVTVNPSGTVDTATVGTYTITYSATDVAGNAAATKTRTVIVYDPVAGFVSRFASVTIPGNYTTPGIWDESGSSGNSMILVDNFKWRLLYDFTSARSIEYKVVGGASWASAYQWGAGGALGAGNATASVTAGRYAFELDELLNSASLTRVGDLPPSALSYTPSLASGTVGTAITSLNPSVTGTVTSYSVSPALPLGLTLNTSSGVISGTPSAASALDTYTVTAVNGTGNTTATVMIEVSAPAGSTFAGAYPGASMTGLAPNGLTYLANYAFGGNETTPATLPVQDTSDPTKLRLVVVFRTDDSTLPLNALGGETTADLAGGWSASGVSVEDSTDVSPVPPNTVRKVISVDRGTASKKFLRATVTK